MHLYVYAFICYAFITHWAFRTDVNNMNGKGWQGFIRDSMSLKRSKTHSRCCNSALQMKVLGPVAAEFQ